MNILLFGGTVEGRKLSGLFAKEGTNVTLIVATDYGKSLLPHEGKVTAYAGRMDKEAMLSLINANQFDYILDATHPYARIVTQNIKEAAEIAGVPYIRLVRKSGTEITGQAGAAMCHVTYAASAEEAADYLKDTQGNIFLTVGSKDLDVFTKIDNYAQRVYARMIPMIESLQKAASLGFWHKNLICMQGPFNYDTNKAMLAAAKAKYMVTKDSGDAGGFAAKLSAAADLDCQVIVIARPSDETGLTYEEILERFGLEEGSEAAGASTDGEDSEALDTHAAGTADCEALDASTDDKGSETLDTHVARTADREVRTEEQTDRTADRKAGGFFPIFVDMRGRTVLMIGGGAVASRRALILCEYGADIVVISPAVSHEMERAVREGKVRHLRKAFEAEDIAAYRPFLVIAATDKREVNHAVMEAARANQTLHIISDCKEECGAWFAAIAQSDAFTAGIISKRGDHAALKELAERLRRVLNE